MWKNHSHHQYKLLGLLILKSIDFIIFIFTKMQISEILNFFFSKIKLIFNFFRIFRDNSPYRSMFIEKLVDDRSESSLSYYEFLQHLRTQVK